MTRERERLVGFSLLNWNGGDDTVIYDLGSVGGGKYRTPTLDDPCVKLYFRMYFPPPDRKAGYTE